MLLNFRVVEVYIWMLILVSIIKKIMPVALKSGGKLFELHDITGQRACFIWEDVLDLPKFFVKVTCLRIHGHVLFLIIHVDIVMHKEALAECH